MPGFGFVRPFFFCPFVPVFLPGFAQFCQFIARFCPLFARFCLILPIFWPRFAPFVPKNSRFCLVWPSSARFVRFRPNLPGFVRIRSSPVWLVSGIPGSYHTMCHVSCVTCHMFPVTCQKRIKKIQVPDCFIIKSGGAGRWRVCYQQGSPRLVLLSYDLFW